MQRYRITVSYDGSAYSGWQVQPNHVTVQQRLEEALGRLTGETPKIHGSGRTDQGVHARGQVAHFDLEKPWIPQILHRGLNALLPEDIRIQAVARAAPDFHARRSAVGKEYRYFIWNAAVPDPCRRRYSAHVRRKLDARSMQAAAAALIGRHDFAALTANPNRDIESTVRDLRRLAVRKKGAEIVITAASDGFLYKMVRSICGLLIRVGEGAETAASVREILASRVRTARVPTAPPQGLFLWRVWY
jgi:tRNA pseudouridine38-40 synthase